MSDNVCLIRVYATRGVLYHEWCAANGYPCDVSYDSFLGATQSEIERSAAYDADYPVRYVLQRITSPTYGLTPADEEEPARQLELFTEVAP